MQQRWRSNDEFKASTLSIVWCVNEDLCQIASSSRFEGTKWMKSASGGVIISTPIKQLPKKLQENCNSSKSRSFVEENLIYIVLHRISFQSRTWCQRSFWTDPEKLIAFKTHIDYYNQPLLYHMTKNSNYLNHIFHLY